MYKFNKENGKLGNWSNCNRPYLGTDQIKSFLEDIYICDSEDIISLEDNHLYTWGYIENAVKRYERKELENV